MSNIEAGKLYEAVIEEVISDSRQDFENSGIDEVTLQELRKVWCEKLTQTQVAKFSWDDSIDLENLDHGHGHLQGGVLSHLNLGSAGGLEIPGITGDSQLSYNSTTDIGSLNTAEVNDLGIQLPNVEGGSFKQEYDDNGGLMLPSMGQSDGNFEITIETKDPKRLLQKLRRQQQKKSKLIQADGADDDDDDEKIFNDSDDINSDLDDEAESERSDYEDGEAEANIMLCLYDKVQRVKNKWKCNLKEGVANINGHDYAFQKATGESEW